MTTPSKTDAIIAALQADPDLTTEELRDDHPEWSRQLIAKARDTMEADERREPGRPIKTLRGWLVRAWPVLERLIETRHSGDWHAHGDAWAAWDEWEAKNPRPKNKESR